MASRTKQRMVVPAVTAQQMREVDRMAVEEFGQGNLRLMKNAGRGLVVEPLFGTSSWLRLTVDDTVDRSGDTIYSDTEGGSH